MLEKENRYWWGTVKERTGITTKTWEEFVTEFNLKYSNPDMMIAQQMEFSTSSKGE